MTKKKTEEAATEIPEASAVTVTAGTPTTVVQADTKLEEIDWNTRIDKQNGVILMKNGGGEFILLKELLRLGRLKGIKRMSTYVVQAPASGNGGIACATASIEFKDGTSFDGSADASEASTDGAFGLYLTAMAESRAIARALRFGLGITMCAFEEVSSKSLKEVPLNNPDGHLTAPQKQCIEELLKRKKFDLEEVLALGSRKVSSLDELTNKEARDLITALNDGTIEKAFKGKK